MSRRNVRCHSACAAVVAAAMLFTGVGSHAQPPSPPALSAPSPASDDEAKAIAEVAELSRQIGNLYRDGKYAEAIPLAQRVVDLQRKFLGPSNPYYATALNNLANLYKNAGRYTEAEPLFEQAIAVYRQTIGTDAPDFAMGLNNLAGLYEVTGRGTQAEPLYQQVIAINRKALGDAHPNTIAAINNLALLYKNAGDYANAEQLYQQALDGARKSLDKSSRVYTTALNNLASLYREMGDDVRAEPLYREVLDARRETVGEDHPDYAVSLNNLASIYRDVGDAPQALALYLQASEIWKKTLGEHHPLYAFSLNNLADLYLHLEQYDKAETLLRQAMAINRETGGPAQAAYTTNLTNLALVYKGRGDVAESERLLRQVLEIERRALGPRHPSYATDLDNLAVLYDDLGQHQRADPLHREAMDIGLRQLDDVASAQSQRQQLAMEASIRGWFDTYLAACLTTNGNPTQIYNFWLAWKGQVLRRHRQLRAAADAPELKAQFAELDGVTAQLAQLAVESPGSDGSADTQQTLTDLSVRKERLEQQLAARCDAFRETLSRPSVEALVRAMPRDAVLIDYVDYWHREAAKPATKQREHWDRRLAAFVVSTNDPLRLVDLGPLDTAAAAINAWRRDFGQTTSGRAAGRRLREQIWAPLEAHLAGAKKLLISPDGPLGQFPFAALPTIEGDCYLLEDLPIAIVPSPVELVEVNTSPQLTTPPTLLIVADVDYGHSDDAGDSPLPTKPRNTWSDLPGTKAERDAILKVFGQQFRQGKQIDLERAAATEQAFRHFAPTATYLHLATHGYFSPAPSRAPNDARRPKPALGGMSTTVFDQSVASLHPGVRSGFVLAGANLPASQVGDGLLTAEEVMSLDLRRVQLCVLSACETGLGEVASGEGLLGLQRAFQAAGANTVVASLWQVPDLSTQLLMTRFYENLWQRKMTKLDALRDAQLWMLREVPRNPDLLAQTTRGLGLDLAEDATTTTRLSPRHWAAFILSGDWR
ncbi:MAG TPA: CHAT domain-containing tetratricopeptide repeat protein [Pirellulales bacterium]|nr:CHAT domain-containing tetratricopeptide repeat protein [Pirellulales bacterium]